MIIVLGGFVYNGRHILARHLAAITGAHLYPVHEKKLKDLRKSASSLDNVLHPTTDAEYDALYNKILVDLPLLVKMHDIVIIDDAFHREGPRERFLASAKRLDKTVFVWVDSPDETVKNRLPYLRKVGAARDEADAYRRLESRKTQMEFFMPPLIYMHRVSDRRAAVRLKHFIDFVVSRGFTAT